MRQGRGRRHCVRAALGAGVCLATGAFLPVAQAQHAEKAREIASWQPPSRVPDSGVNLGALPGNRVLAAGAGRFFGYSAQGRRLWSVPGVGIALRPAYVGTQGRWYVNRSGLDVYAASGRRVASTSTPCGRPGPKGSLYTVYTGPSERLQRCLGGGVEAWVSVLPVPVRLSEVTSSGPAFLTTETATTAVAALTSAPGIPAVILGLSRAGGEALWVRQLGEGVALADLEASRGTVFVEVRAGAEAQVIALDGRTGLERWRKASSGRGIAADPSGGVVLGTSPKTGIAAIGPSGSMRWARQTPSYSFPWLVKAGHAYAQQGAKEIRSYGAQTGVPQWRYQTSGPVFSFSAGSRVAFVATTRGRVSAIAAP